MSDRRPLASRDVLDDRYELQDLVTEKLGATTWRAHDQVLSRNVGIEMLPSSDPRAERFVEAARKSTHVTDPRFLRVLDVVEDDHGHHFVVREWARAFPLERLLAQSPMPNRRAATVVAEVAEALAHAHEKDVHHLALTPHHVLLKQSGAVRISGLGMASALLQAEDARTVEDVHASEQEDVQAIGRILYSCLVSRWPGGHLEELAAAPTEHGRLLRPRQVRAGVSRDIDAVCDRILGTPPRDHRKPLRTAADIARTLRLVGEDEEHLDDQPSLVDLSSPDLLRLDPVIVPAGPPPGLEPPRRRPKAFEPAPPSTLERSKARAVRATKGDRGFILLGVVGAMAIAAVLAFLVGRSSGEDGEAPAPDRAAVVQTLPIADATDLDPQGEDGEENPDEVPLAHDGDPTTGWRTSTYFGQAALGGLKDGVGLTFDLGGPREVRTMRILLEGEGTALSVHASAPGAETPTSPRGLTRVARVRDAGTDVTVSFPDGTITRHLVVWLERLPQVEPGEFQGQVLEVVVQGID